MDKKGAFTHLKKSNNSPSQNGSALHLYDTDKRKLMFILDNNCILNIFMFFQEVGIIFLCFRYDIQLPKGETVKRATPPPNSPQLFQEHTRDGTKGRCECRPGYSPLGDNRGCQLPLIALAKFLNGEDYFHR